MSKYDEIINLSHHRSSTHPPMPRSNRAAQFAPFAALTGYYSAVEETGRLTEAKIELDDYTMETLNRKTQFIKESIAERPLITVTYFVPDKRKSGGKYVNFSGNIRLIDEVNREFVFDDGTKIKIENIIDINAEGLNIV